MQNALLQPAFSDPVTDAQSVFRLALTAMSEPGTVQEVGCDSPAQDAIGQAAYALCLTLFDSDTQVWLSPALDSASLRSNLAFHCACPVVADPKDADFALLTAADLSELGAFRTGTDRDPDTSCTLIVQLDKLDGGAPTAWQGPGIGGKASMRLPVPATLWQQRRRHGFPRGLDMFFTAGLRFTALPRSTRVLHTMQEAI